MFPSNIIQCYMEKKHNTSCQIWIINIYYLQNNTQCEVNWTRSIKQKISFILRLGWCSQLTHIYLSNSSSAMIQSQLCLVGGLSIKTISNFLDKGFFKSKKKVNNKQPKQPYLGLFRGGFSVFYSHGSYDLSRRTFCVVQHDGEKNLKVL